jgi:hypothetical protein
MIILLTRINQLIFVVLKCGVLFEVRTEFLNIISMSFGFKGLIPYIHTLQLQPLRDSMPKSLQCYTTLKTEQKICILEAYGGCGAKRVVMETLDTSP